MQEVKIETAFEKKYGETLDNLGWRIYPYTQNGEERVEIENWSPLGEDLILDFGCEDFPAELEEYINDYDPDEHCRFWVERWNEDKSVPKSVRALIDDADEIEEMLEDLLLAVVQVAN